MSNYSDSAFDEENVNSSWYKVFERIPAKQTVLDVGCSSGNFGAELIKRKQCVVDGIEISESDAKLARKQLREVYVMDIERDDLSVIKHKYDVLYFGDVVEHLSMPAQTLHRIQRLLKPGGKIVFSIPNMAHATIRLLLLKGDFDYTETGLLDKTHLHFYSLDEVYRVFQEAGYAVQNVDFVQKDYPNAVIEDYLKEVGLLGSDQFYDLMRQPDAAAFQFVGEAVIAKKPVKVKREQFGPIDLFESYFNNTVNPLRQEIEELRQQTASLQAENQQLHERIDSIIKHPIKNVARAAKYKIKR